jgi:hypothetical protein
LYIRRHQREIQEKHHTQLPCLGTMLNLHDF